MYYTLDKHNIIIILSIRLDLLVVISKSDEFTQ